jgi:hypothetical protein
MISLWEDYFLVCVNLCASLFAVLSVLFRLCNLCFCQVLVMIFIVSLKKYMRLREH